MDGGIPFNSEIPVCKKGDDYDLAHHIDIGGEKVRIDSRYFRPTETDELRADVSKAKADMSKLIGEDRLTLQQL